MSLIPGWGRYPGEGNGNLLQYSFLGNPRDRGVWRAKVHGVAKNQIWLSTHPHIPHDCFPQWLLFLKFITYAHWLKQNAQSVYWNEVKRVFFKWTFNAFWSHWCNNFLDFPTDISILLMSRFHLQVPNWETLLGWVPETEFSLVTY